MQRTIVIVALALLTVTADAKLSDEELSSIARVGVISLVADEMQLRYEAPTTFGDEEYTVSVARLEIGRFVASSAQTFIEQRSRYEAESIHDTGARLRRPGRVDGYDPIFAAAEQHGMDTVIVILAKDRPAPKYYGGGYGLLVRRNSLFGEPGLQCAFSWLTIEVWDVASRKRLDRESGLNCDRDERIEIRPGLSSYSGAEQGTIVELVKQSLERSTWMALYGIGLVQ